MAAVRAAGLAAGREREKRTFNAHRPRSQLTCGVQANGCHRHALRQDGAQPLAPDTASQVRSRDTRDDVAHPCCSDDPGGREQRQAEWAAINAALEQSHANHRPKQATHRRRRGQSGCARPRRHTGVRPPPASAAETEMVAEPSEHFIHACVHSEGERKKERKKERSLWPVTKDMGRLNRRKLLTSSGASTA
jgi:hypothetical protein